MQDIWAFAPGDVHSAIPEFLKEYARFHRQSMLQVASNAEDAGHVNFLVYSCEPGRCGGFGDRFKGIVGALYLAAACVPMFTRSGRRWSINALSPPPRYMRNNIPIKAGGRLDGERLVSDCSARQQRNIHLLLNVEGWNDILDSDAAASNMRAATGSPWIPPQGPRFAWAWHFLFRPSPALRKCIARLQATLGIPGHGTPWVATHMRVAASTEFPDSDRRDMFCDIDDGARRHARCAARITQLVSRPPFARAPIDPSNVTVFVASDNQEAVASWRQHMLRQGHQGAAMVATGRRAVHSDDVTAVSGGVPSGGSTPSDATPPATEPGSAIKDSPGMGSAAATSASDGAKISLPPPSLAFRHQMVHTIAEMSLLSRATCIVMGGQSGFSATAMLLSRDMSTGARCHSVVPASEAIECGDEEDLRDMSFRHLPAGAGVPLATDWTRAPFREDTSRIPERLTLPGPLATPPCSAILKFGGPHCPKPWRADVTYGALMRGRALQYVLPDGWAAPVLQGDLARVLSLPDRCLVDITFFKEEVPLQQLQQQRQQTLYIKVTVFADDEAGQVAAGEALLRQHSSILELLRGVLTFRLRNQAQWVLNEVCGALLGVVGVSHHPVSALTCSWAHARVLTQPCKCPRAVVLARLSLGVAEQCQVSHNAKHLRLQHHLVDHLVASWLTNGTQLG
eukprot:jgi/Mesvir1/7435/Mv19216-RA.1